jgi:3-dehydroquinate synthase
LLPELKELAGVYGSIALITDSNVFPLHAHRCGHVDVYSTMKAGEQHKRLQTVETIYHELLGAGFDRSGAIVALGGGVVGDVAGFVAATYMRGVKLIQCPTSLLAMVDASVGGKTGVDLPEGKNLVGVFKQPAAVLADLSTLETLPDVELRSGLAEVVKHGIIGSPEILEMLEGVAGASSGRLLSSKQELARLVTMAIRVKRDIVQEDPFETGRRAVLNLGHTFAHAIERVSHYAVRHGQAVAMGLVAAAHLSNALGHGSDRLLTRIEDLLSKLDLPTRIPRDLPPAQLMAAMGSDKKKSAGKLHFVLARAVGDVFVTSAVTESEILGTLVAVSV